MVMIGRTPLYQLERVSWIHAQTTEETVVITNNAQIEPVGESRTGDLKGAGAPAEVHGATVPNPNAQTILLDAASEERNDSIVITSRGVHTASSTIVGTIATSKTVQNAGIVSVSILATKAATGTARAPKTEIVVTVGMIAGTATIVTGLRGAVTEKTNAVGTRTDPLTNAISAATITRDVSVISITAGAIQKIVTIVVLTVASVAMIVVGLGTSPGISIASLGEISETIVTTIGEMASVAKSVGTTTVMIVAGTIGAVKIAGKSVRTGSQENVVGMIDVRTVALTGMMIDAARSVGMIDVTIKAAKSAGAISETTSEVKSAGAIAVVSRIMTETFVAMTGQITVRGIASPVNSIVVTKTGDRVKTVTRSSEITGASVKFATSV